MAEWWNRFFRGFQKDFKLWLFFVAILSVNRAAFILCFRGELASQAVPSAIFLAFLQGIRFDVLVATYFALPTLIMSLLLMGKPWEAAADRFRSVYGGASFAVMVILALVTVEYYREFHDIFNPFLFQAQDDDLHSILSTIYSDCHPFRYLFLAAAIILAGLWIRRRWFSGLILKESLREKRLASHFARMAASAAIVGMVFLGIRGSTTYQPLKVQDAAVTDSRMLNKAVVNPPMALIEAWNVYCQSRGKNGSKFFLPGETIASALQKTFPHAAASANIDAYCERKAGGPLARRPRQIFILFLESYDGWAMLDKYAGLGLEESGRRMAREGLYLPSFLAGGCGSIDSLTNLVAGIPSSSLLVRVEKEGQKPLPTALASTFRRLGYRTRFFYGGFLSWQEVGDFMQHQGFQEVYGAGHAKAGSLANEWGLADEALYDLVERTVADNQDSLILIYTTTYHPPYSFDLKALGVTPPAVPPELDAEFTADRARTLHILAHLKYSDRAMGDFVARMEKRFPDALFVLTGDHPSRRFINASPTTFESTAVPLVLYGKNVLQGVKLPDRASGSHLDIIPTLIEAVAPKGFRYWTMGHNLLDPAEDFFAHNSRTVMGADFVMNFDSPGIFAPVAGRPLSTNHPAAHELLQRVHRLQAIAWWRVREGPAFQQNGQMVKNSPAPSHQESMLAKKPSETTRH
jgi:phosphoglycerol transferase MdoB-like AlkP superfamily enzyme